MASGLEQGAAERFVATALRNPLNAAVLRRLPQLGLPDCWVVAGCLFQAIWNDTAGRPADAGVKDCDIFYFDAADLSWEAEDCVIERLRSAFADLAVAIDVKNQARVHLWYEQRFGHPYPQLISAQDGIDRFPVAGTCIGLSPHLDGHAALYAPFGLDDAAAGILRPNPLTNEPASFRAKAASYQARWPHLTVEICPAAPPLRSRHVRVSLGAA